MSIFNEVVKAVLDFFLPHSVIDKKASSITKAELALKIKVKRNNDGSFITLFDYSDEMIKRMIWLLKYKRNKRIARVFGEILNDYLIEEISERIVFSNFTDPVLIPIPLSKKRMRERGYNQSELIARELISAGGEVFNTLSTDIIKRKRDAQSQTSLKDRRARIENMKGAFSVYSHGKIKGRNIIVLDDVTTTGSTLNEARKVLLDAGARQVLCVAIAH
jgi:competence protein ComFC